MSSTFDRYDDEFSSLIQQIEEGLHSEPPTPYTESLLKQCDDLIKQMALEARSVQEASVKRSLLDKVKKYKAKYQGLQAESDRQGLLGSSSQQQGQRERLLLQKNEDMLSRQNETLERARRTMEETEAVAFEITEELGHNREKLMSAHGRVREMTGLTGRASRILTAMNQRAVQQKMVLYGVAVTLVLGFIVLLYTMWR